MVTKPYTKTEQVQTTLTVEQREQLDAYAAALPASRADAIRRLIVEGLAAEFARRPRRVVTGMEDLSAEEVERQLALQHRGVWQTR